MTYDPRSPRPPEPILHVDLDAFYASVETQKDPSLAGKPVVVAGGGTRGVVLSASYEARRFGVDSAMPAVRAKRLAPSAIFVPPDFDAYRTYSNRFRDVLLGFTPLVEPLSLDEAFLDVGGAVLLFGSPQEIGRRIRAVVQAELGVTCSVGVAPNKFLAKMASTRAKPDGMLVVPVDGIHRFLEPLPVRALWGVGEKTMEMLGKLGIRTIADLGAVPVPVLARVIGEAHATGLVQLAQGRDERVVVPFEAPKSISHEETFERDLDDREEILRELLALSTRVAARLRSDGYAARTVVLKVRLSNFSTLTRSQTLPRPTDVANEIHAVVRDLFLRLPGERRRIRLLGVGGSGLTSSASEQLALLRTGQWSDVERAVDRIEGRFGKGTALPAALLTRTARSRRPVPESPTSSEFRPKGDRSSGEDLKS